MSDIIKLVNVETMGNVAYVYRDSKYDTFEVLEFTKPPKLDFLYKTYFSWGKYVLLDSAHAELDQDKKNWDAIPAWKDKLAQ